MPLDLSIFKEYLVRLANRQAVGCVSKSGEKIPLDSSDQAGNACGLTAQSLSEPQSLL
jgi:hypothetical protein